MSARIVILNRFYLPDNCATAQITADLANALVRSGAVEVQIVCGRAAYVDHPDERPVEESRDGVGICRLWTTRFGRRSLAGRMLDYLSMHAAALIYLLRKVHPSDILVVGTDPPLISITVAVASWFRPIRYVVWSQDVFPEIASAVWEYQNLEQSAPRSFSIWFRKLFKVALKPLNFLRDWSYRRAQSVVCISESMQAYFVGRDVSRKKLELIENWAIQRTGSEQSAQQKRMHWGLPEDRLIISHFGNLGRGHDYRLVLSAANQLKGVGSPLWLMVGGGHGYKELQKAAEADPQLGFQFQPYVALDELGSALMVPDLHWMSQPKTMDAFLFPSKFYGIIAAGKPVVLLGNPESQLGRIIREHHIGFVFGENDLNEFVHCLKTLQGDKRPLAQMAENARGLYNRAYQPVFQHQKWYRLLMRTITLTKD
jgi:glycosyltransferase involved in cell wall biosynthesis